MKKKTVLFPKQVKLGKRDWGDEILCALIPKKISLKILKLKKGKKGGLQYHRLLIRYEGTNGKLKKKIMKKGDSFYFPPGSIHQEEALTNCEIIEASTPYFNDRVRVEKKFGLSDISGLRTTKAREIKLK